MRLTLTGPNGVPQIIAQAGDGWDPPTPVSPTTMRLAAGSYKLRYEYVQNGVGAWAKLVKRWVDPPKVRVAVITDANNNQVMDDSDSYAMAPGTVCAGGYAVAGLTITVSGGGTTVSGPLNICEGGVPQFQAEVPPGSYQVALSGLPSGWPGVTSASVTAIVGATQIIQLTMQPPAERTARVVLDRNTNGQFDGNDTYITSSSTPCARSTAFDGIAAVWRRNGVTTTGTTRCAAGDGAYFSASWLAPGGYTLEATIPPGWSTSSQIVLVRDEERNGRPVYTGEKTVFVTPPPCLATVPNTQWRADFYGNVDLSGQPVATTNAGAGNLAQDWGNGSPSFACGVPTDGFSARFSRDVYFSAGVYRFTATADDGVALYVDGNRVVNGWWDHVPQTSTGDVALAEGSHHVVVQYYERSGGALVSANWSWIAPLPQPPGTLYPNQHLYANQVLWSPNGYYQLVYQGDGNLVLYTWDWFVVWQAERANTDPGDLVMQGDGNLVIYDGWGDPIWWTGTDGNNGAYLAVQNDGNLVVYNSSGTRALWSLW